MLEQLVGPVKAIVDHDDVMHTGSLCKLDLLDSSVQALRDRFLSFRSTFSEALTKIGKARRCDEEVGGFYG
jgi:hypothetical protein